MPDEVCVWEEQDPDYESYWETSCGSAWCLMEGTPKENEIIYCHTCGKHVQEKRFEYEAEIE